MQPLWPSLAKIARNVLAAPIAKVECERVFSLVKDVIIYRRGRLNGKTIEKIIICKYVQLKHYNHQLSYLQRSSLPTVNLIGVNLEDSDDDI